MWWKIIFAQYNSINIKYNNCHIKNECIFHQEYEKMSWEPSFGFVYAMMPGTFRGLCNNQRRNLILQVFESLWYIIRMETPLRLAGSHWRLECNFQISIPIDMVHENLSIIDTLGKLLFFFQSFLFLSHSGSLDSLGLAFVSHKVISMLNSDLEINCSRFHNSSEFGVRVPEAKIHSTIREEKVLKRSGKTLVNRKSLFGSGKSENLRVS